MRSIAKLMQDWQFTGPDGKATLVELPHTWNAKDGQDGGNDYWRGTCTYSTTFAAPAFDAASQEVWLQFEGVNSSAKVLLNGRNICTHDGGYSTFRVHVSDLLAKDNQLTVEVDNSINDRIYPPEGRLYILRRHLPRHQPDGGQQEPHRSGPLRRHRRQDHPRPQGRQG